eukprot:PhM_4_TR16211/c0_g1_i1/m.94567
MPPPIGNRAVMYIDDAVVEEELDLQETRKTPRVTLLNDVTMNPANACASRRIGTAGDGVESVIVPGIVRELRALLTLLSDASKSSNTASAQLSFIEILRATNLRWLWTHMTNCVLPNDPRSRAYQKRRAALKRKSGRASSDDDDDPTPTSGKGGDASTSCCACMGYHRHRNVRNLIMNEKLPSPTKRSPSPATSRSSSISATGGGGALARRRHTKILIDVDRQDVSIPGVGADLIAQHDNEGGNSFTVSSPRSVLALCRHGVHPEHLPPKNLQQYQQQSLKEGALVSPRGMAHRMRLREAERKSLCRTVLQEYYELCSAVSLDTLMEHLTVVFIEDEAALSTTPCQSRPVSALGAVTAGHYSAQEEPLDALPSSRDATPRDRSLAPLSKTPQPTTKSKNSKQWTPPTVQQRLQHSKELLKRRTACKLETQTKQMLTRWESEKKALSAEVHHIARKAQQHRAGARTPSASRRGSSVNKSDRAFAQKQEEEEGDDDAGAGDAAALPSISSTPPKENASVKSGRSASPHHSNAGTPQTRSRHPSLTPVPQEPNSLSSSPGAAGSTGPLFDDGGVSWDTRGPLDSVKSDINDSKKLTTVRSTSPKLDATTSSLNRTRSRSNGRGSKFVEVKDRRERVIENKRLDAERVMKEKQQRLDQIKQQRDVTLQQHREEHRHQLRSRKQFVQRAAMVTDYQKLQYLARQTHKEQAQMVQRQRDRAMVAQAKFDLQRAERERRSVESEMDRRKLELEKQLAHEHATAVARQQQEALLLLSPTRKKSSLFTNIPSLSPSALSSPQQKVDRMETFLCASQQLQDRFIKATTGHALTFS